MTLAGVTSSNRTDPDLLIDPNSGDIERETQISTQWPRPLPSSRTSFEGDQVEAAIRFQDAEAVELYWITQDTFCLD